VQELISPEPVRGYCRDTPLEEVDGLLCIPYGSPDPYGAKGSTGSARGKSKKGRRK